MVALNTYTNVTANDIAVVLQPLGFVRMDLPGTDEIVFSKKITFEQAPTIIRIYTGVLRATGQSRPVGQDAIRVCLGRLIDGHVRIFKTLPTVRRTGTWSLNLLQRLSDIGNGLVAPKPVLTERDLLEGRVTPTPKHIPKATELACPICGAHMVGPKHGKRGPFFGCSRFPVCRGLLNVADLPDAPSA